MQFIRSNPVVTIYYALLCTVESMQPGCPLKKTNAAENALLLLGYYYVPVQT